MVTDGRMRLKTLTPGKHCSFKMMTHITYTWILIGSTIRTLLSPLLKGVTSMIKQFFSKHTQYKKVGGLHFIKLWKFGFSFYVAKKVCHHVQ
jgi:hypothetical protein